MSYEQALHPPICNPKIILEEILDIAKKEKKIFMQKKKIVDSSKNFCKFVLLYSEKIN